MFYFNGPFSNLNVSSLRVAQHDHAGFCYREHIRPKRADPTFYAEQTLLCLQFYFSMFRKKK